MDMPDAKTVPEGEDLWNLNCGSKAISNDQ